MASQSIAQELVNITAAGTNYTTFTTQKSVLNNGTPSATAASTGVIALPSNFFQLGARLEIEFQAGVSSVTGNTMIFSVVAGAVNIFTSATIKVSTTTGVLEQWVGKILLTVRSVGNGTLATIMGGGTLSGRTVCPAGATAGAIYTAGMGNCSLVEAAPAVGSGFDSTIPNTLDFQVAMGTSAAGNGIQIQQYSVKSWGNTSA